MSFETKKFEVFFFISKVNKTTSLEYRKSSNHYYIFFICVSDVYQPPNRTDIDGNIIASHNGLCYWNCPIKLKSSSKMYDFASKWLK